MRAHSMPGQISELDTESPSSPRKTHFLGNSTRRHGDVTRGKSVSWSGRLVALFGMAYDREVEGKDLVTEAIIGAAIEVHRHLGPGFLESTYEQCLCWELRDAGLTFVRQTMIPINYKGIQQPECIGPTLW